MTAPEVVGDELAARREAKRAQMLARPIPPLVAIEEAEELAVGLVVMCMGELLVDAAAVWESAKRIDQILLGLRNHELDRGAQ